MPLPTETRTFFLANPPVGAIKPDTFSLETRPLPKESELKDGEVVIKVVALSNDPAQRMWIDGQIDPKRLYTDPVKKGDPMRSLVLADVVASNSQKIKVGQRVTTGAFWTEYAVVKDATVRPAVTVKGHSDYLAIGALGLTGVTAYVGAFSAFQVKPEHTVCVSGAAGAVGMVMVQLCKKVIGCKRVVGIAGGKEKCDWVKSLGADECVDYKDPNYASNLAAALPDYCDLYFDNVGGSTLDLMLALTKRHGTILACGAISSYMSEDPTVPMKNVWEIVMNRLTVKGFIVTDYLAEWMKAVTALKGWIEEGKLVVTEETVVDTKFEDVPKTWQGLFSGQNRGKLVTHLV